MVHAANTNPADDPADDPATDPANPASPINPTNPNSVNAMILAGADRYWDRYHDFAATSQDIAEALAEVGIRARIRSHLRSALANLGDIDLLVVNCSGNPRDPCRQVRRGGRTRTGVWWTTPARGGQSLPSIPRRSRSRTFPSGGTGSAPAGNPADPATHRSTPAESPSAPTTTRSSRA